MHRWPRIIVLDTEFVSRDDEGENPIPVCLCARELHSGKEWRLWQDELFSLRQPPFPIDASTLCVAYSSPAEWGVFRQLKWAMPQRILDLYVEFRNALNGYRPLAGNWKLISAMAHYGLDPLDAVEKKEMIDLILRGGPWSHDERTAILNYCFQDVTATAALLKAMWPSIHNIGQALLRGRYMPACSIMRSNGVPIDLDRLRLLRAEWSSIRLALIDAVDPSFNVYEDGHFREHLFENYLASSGIGWPRLPSGRLSLEDKVFRRQAQLYPVLESLRQLRTTLNDL
jgi:DNA polymerase-1